MKKLLIAAAASAVLIGGAAQAYAVESVDLRFTQDNSGKYIYCNNHEFIRRSDLADISNERPKYIMNNEDLTPDKYAMFISHVNHTEERSDDGYTILEAGFDIEVDVIFRAEEDTVINLTSVGFEVPQNRQYWYEGTSYTSEDEWGCFNAWSSYLGLPIKQIDSGTEYNPQSIEPVTINIKAGESVWLSQYIPNYDVVPFYRPVNIMADFTIVSGKCDVNVAALRSNGTIGDRSGFIENSAYGSYDRDRQYKGISDGLNRVDASLSYTIDDYTWSDTTLPVKVYNSYMPEGNETDKWYTHLNPRADPWSNLISAESDMLAFKYNDPSKVNYYGKNVKDTDTTWYFDTEHTDLSEYVKGEGMKINYSPNRLLKEDEGTEYACNLGNYGVLYNYNISITNNGGMIRYINYVPNTGSNIVVILRDENGNLMTPYAVCKGYNAARVKNTMACVELPPQKTTTFNLQVVLTTNYAGGIENALTITDTPQMVEVYKSGRQEIIKDYNYTGREFYKWENRKLYISDDLESWREVPLEDDVKYTVYGNWSEYELKYTGNGYMLKATIYDGIPYYQVCDFFRTVYFLDENFHMVSKHEFDYYPTAFTAAKDLYYVKAGTPVYSNDTAVWNMSLDTQMPCWNYGEYVAKCKDGKIYLSSDGINFTEKTYEGFDPTYIDAIGNIYYYAEGREFYYSFDALTWKHITASEEISSIYKVGNEIVINKTEHFEL